MGIIVLKIITNQNYHKSYNNYCLKDCKDSSGLFKIETFLKDNICVEDCFQNGKYYKSKIPSSGDYKCVQNCESGQYINNLECVAQCPPTGNKYHIENKYECLSQCPDGYYSYENNMKIVVMKNVLIVIHKNYMLQIPKCV